MDTVRRSDASSTASVLEGDEEALRLPIELKSSLGSKISSELATLIFGGPCLLAAAIESRAAQRVFEGARVRAVLRATPLAHAFD